MLSVVSAQGCASPGFMGTFQQDTNVTITETCPTCTFINITIKDPVSTQIILNEPMTSENSMFNFTLNDSLTNTIGTYFIEGHSNLDTPVKACFDITNIKRQTSTPESLVYIVLVIASFSVFALALWGAVAIPFNNPRNEFSQIISVSYLKYLKVGLMFISYALFVWMVNLMFAMAENLVSLTQYSGFFQMVFNFLLNLTWPMFVIMFISFFVLGSRDLKLNDLLRRGLRPR